MYLHIVPALYHTLKNKCYLERVFIPEIDFVIKSEDLSTGSPFANMFFNIGSRKCHKPEVGILVKTDQKLKNFTTVSVWNIEGLPNITHKVITYIDDDSYDMVTHDAKLTMPTKLWDNRTHPAYEGEASKNYIPRMDSVKAGDRDLACDMWEEYDWGDYLIEREESYLALTIPSQRIMEARTKKTGRYSLMPALENAFIAPC